MRAKEEALFSAHLHGAPIKIIMLLVALDEKDFSCPPMYGIASYA